MARNPAWTRDELILALELYKRTSWSALSQRSPEVIELSKILNRLPLHDPTEGEETFRNPNGVYMKLANFAAHDPGYPGEGLKRGNRLEESVWDEFSNDFARLQQVAKAIRQIAQAPSLDSSVKHPHADEELAPEGRVLFRLHRSRERNRTLVRKKKESALRKNGKLTL